MTPSAYTIPLPIRATQPAPKPAALQRGAIRLMPGIDTWGPEEIAERLANDEWDA